MGYVTPRSYSGIGLVESVQITDWFPIAVSNIRVFSRRKGMECSDWIISKLWREVLFDYWIVLISWRTNLQPTSRVRRCVRLNISKNLLPEFPTVNPSYSSLATHNSADLHLMVVCYSFPLRLSTNMKKIFIELGKRLFV